MAEKSIQIKLQSSKSGILQLGQVCKFSISRKRADIETRVFVTHQNIRYLKPIMDWDVHDDVLFFPEAPGNYTLAVQWRNQDGSSGWNEYPFRVRTNDETIPSPIRTKIEKDTYLWAPSEWEARCLQGYEKSVFDRLSGVVRRGYVIYDIGSSLGQYSVWFSRTVGKNGCVYCFEANPLCIYWLQVNLELNRASNCEIIPIALGDNASPIAFTINYGNSALGITSDSPFYRSKAGHEINVPCSRLDDLLETYHLKKPDLIKVDVEGSEEALVSGMEHTLTRFRPVLFIEIHGQASAVKTFHRIAKLGYTFTDIRSNKTFENVDELIEWFPDAVRQFLCDPIE
jgi:FkbM family methyltransferase